MGFPLHRGTVSDGILTCHWHHARFDSRSGGTFDQWADDCAGSRPRCAATRSGSTSRPRGDPRRAPAAAPADGLEREHLARDRQGRDRGAPRRPGEAASRSGPASIRRRYRGGGWGRGLTMLTCLMNLLPRLDPRSRPPRSTTASRTCRATATAWSRRASRSTRCRRDGRTSRTLSAGSASFIEVRDAEGAERRIVSAVRAGARRRELADMLFAAVTDHRYINIGHPPTSRTRRWKRSTPPAGSDAEAVLRACCGRARATPSGWRSQTPGATRST